MAKQGDDMLGGMGFGTAKPKGGDSQLSKIGLLPDVVKAATGDEEAKERATEKVKSAATIAAGL